MTIFECGSLTSCGCTVLVCVLLNVFCLAAWCASVSAVVSVSGRVLAVLVDCVVLLVIVDRLIAEVGVLAECERSCASSGGCWAGATEMICCDDGVSAEIIELTCTASECDGSVAWSEIIMMLTEVADGMLSVPCLELCSLG